MKVDASLYLKANWDNLFLQHTHNGIMRPDVPGLLVANLSVCLYREWFVLCMPNLLLVLDEKVFLHGLFVQPALFYFQTKQKSSFKMLKKLSCCNISNTIKLYVANQELLRTSATATDGSIGSKIPST